MKHLVITTVLTLAVASPAFAGGSSDGKSGTAATSASGASVSGYGKSTVNAFGANTSGAIATKYGVTTHSDSMAGGKSTGHGSFDGYGEGSATAKFGSHGTH